MASNTADTNANCGYVHPYYTLEFNPTNTCSGSTVQIGDPKLGPLANNGGPTQT